MTAVPEYIAIGNDSTKWGLEDPVIASTLADKAGITASEIQPLRAFVPKLENAWGALQPFDAAQRQATQDFMAAFDGIKTDLSDVRQMMKNNLPANDPLFVALGFNEKQPTDQDGVLSYAVRAFGNAKNLTAAQLAPLAKRKWDTAQFDTALTRVRSAQALNAAQENAKAAAQTATATLYDLIDEFDVLFRPYAKEARRVLADLTGALDKMQLAKGVPAKPQRPTYHPRKPKPPVSA